MVRTTIKDTGEYIIKIVEKLPKRGNYGIIYIEKLEEQDSFSYYNLYQSDGTYKKILLKSDLLGYTVETLPEGKIGDRAYVLDALNPVYLSPVETGGSVISPVFFNGTDWIVA